LSYTETLTESAGPGPWKYTPCTSTPLMLHPTPSGMTKSSATASSHVSRGVSKFCELDAVVAALSYWSYRTSPEAASAGAQKASAAIAMAPSFPMADNVTLLSLGGIVA
jgi:hypothetical protein